jgi:hypothetical protein
MQLLKYTGGLTLLLLLFASCKKEGIMTYEGTNDVYFRTNYVNSIDTGVVSFGFAVSSIKDSIVKIPVAVMGQVSKQARSVKIVVADSSTAIAGTHYDALPDTFKIGAGRTVDTLLLKVHRTADLQQKGVTIILLLQDNSEFSTAMKTKTTNSITGAYFSFIKYRINLNDIFEQPKYWYVPYVGTFSRKKVYVMSQVLGLTPQQISDVTSSSTSLGTENYYGRTVQIYLNQQKAAGTPVLEDDGSAMAMGTLVQ